jgi:autotransporter adhesin
VFGVPTVADGLETFADSSEKAGPTAVGKLALAVSHDGQLAIADAALNTTALHATTPTRISASASSTLTDLEAFDSRLFTYVADVVFGTLTYPSHHQR